MHKLKFSAHPETKISQRNKKTPQKQQKNADLQDQFKPWKV